MALTFSFLNLDKSEFKTYAIIVDNTDAPTGTGTVLAASVTNENHYTANFTSNGGSGSCTLNLPPDSYAIYSCIMGYTATLSSFIVVSDSTVTLHLASGSCPF